jgi:AcrR family transcriptional regulator
VTTRGDRTRAKLIEATRSVVSEVGYARASTRAIAAAAGVAEGTIYRHFPDKAALFFAAALEPSQAVLDHVTDLPMQAGRRTVADNLTEVLIRLTELQERVIPLEIAVLADPELAAQRRAAASTAAGVPGPPQAIAAYLAAEQRLGRIRGDIDPTDTAVLLLATLFGLAITTQTMGRRLDAEHVRIAAAVLIDGLAPR